MSMQFEGKGELLMCNRRSVLFANNNLTYIQMGQLQKDMNELMVQNKKKYMKIMQCRSDFEYQLYKMGQFQANSKAYGKQLMLRHIYRLLEEKNYLDRELFLIGFKEEEQIKEKEMMVSNETNHFQLLKSIWKKENGSKSTAALQHIEQLNIKIGQIKNNIQSLIRIESNDKKDFQDTYLNTVKTLNQRNRECRKCADLVARDQYLSRKMQRLQQKMSTLSQENITYLQEINNRDEKMKRMNKMNLKLEAELKDRIIRLEQEVLKRDQTIRGLKKVVAEYEKNRFVNQIQGFQVVLKGVSLDLSKFDKKISISCEKLMSILTQEMNNQIKICHEVLTSSVARSKGDSTEDSSKSNRQHVNEQCQFPIFGERMNPESVFVRIERAGGNLLQKKDAGEIIDLKQKIQDSELGYKRYVRTSSKRDIRSNSILRGEQSVTAIKSRGASPTFLLQIE